MKKYDAIIIGFGKGGKTLAADIVNALAQARVVDLRLIERQAKRQQTAA